MLIRIIKTPPAATTPSSAKPGKSTVARAPKITSAAPPAVSTARKDEPMPIAIASTSGFPVRRSSAIRDEVKIP